MTSISKNVYINRLDGIVNKYNSTYQKTIKMKPVDVKLTMYIDFNKNNNKEVTKFKVRDGVRISKYIYFLWKMLCSKLVWRGFCDY